MGLSKGHWSVGKAGVFHTPTDIQIPGPCFSHCGCHPLQAGCFDGARYKPGKMCIPMVSPLKGYFQDIISLLQSIVIIP